MTSDVMIPMFKIPFADCLHDIIVPESVSHASAILSSLYTRNVGNYRRLLPAYSEAPSISATVKRQRSPGEAPTIYSEAPTFQGKRLEYKFWVPFPSLLAYYSSPLSPLFFWPFFSPLGPRKIAFQPHDSPPRAVPTQMVDPIGIVKHRPISGLHHESTLRDIGLEADGIMGFF